MSTWESTSGSRRPDRFSLLRPLSKWAMCKAVKFSPAGGCQSWESFRYASGLKEAQDLTGDVGVFFWDNEMEAMDAQTKRLQTCANQKHQDEDVQTHATHITCIRKINLRLWIMCKDSRWFTRQESTLIHLFSRLAMCLPIQQDQQGPNSRLQGVLVQVINFDGFHFHQQVCHLSISGTLKT